MTITTEDCKNFIKKNSKLLGYASDTWKRVRKYKEGKFVLRDFSNSKGDVLTVCEDERQNLFFYKNASPTESAEKPVSNAIVASSKEPKIFSNWLKLAIEHYSAPCYKDADYSSHQRMLDECLATIQHGMQHDTYDEKDIYFKVESGVEFLVFPNISDTEADFMAISLNELSTFGYIPKKKQSAYDFVDENWNWY